MVHNRNKLIKLMIGNLANAIVHKILEKAIEDDIHRNHYNKEFTNSIEIAKKYRLFINPIERPLPEKDVEDIKQQLYQKVYNELNLRISKGYVGINLELINEFIDVYLEVLEINEKK